MIELNKPEMLTKTTDQKAKKKKSGQPTDYEQIRGAREIWIWSGRRGGKGT